MVGPGFEIGIGILGVGTGRDGEARTGSLPMHGLWSSDPGCFRGFASWRYPMRLLQRVVQCPPAVSRAQVHQSGACLGQSIGSDQVGLAGHADLVLSLDAAGLEALTRVGVAGDDAVQLILGGPEMVADDLAHHRAEIGRALQVASGAPSKDHVVHNYLIFIGCKLGLCFIRPVDHPPSRRPLYSQLPFTADYFHFV